MRYNLGMMLVGDDSGGFVFYRGTRHIFELCCIDLCDAVTEAIHHLMPLEFHTANSFLEL